MIKQTTKIKRGTSFVLNNKNVWCYLDKGTTVLVCDEFNFNLQANFWDVERDELKPAKEFRQGISAKPKQLTPKEKTKKESLNDFFDKLQIPFNCEECNRPLYAHTKFFKRCISCHILPKGLFPSIATNEHNILFMGASLLGICEHHEKWDASIDSRIKMKVYQIAIQRYKLLQPFLSPKEINMADKYLGLC